MPYSDKEKQKEYQRLWVAKNKSDFFSDKCCLKCGATERLELDHLDPSTKVDHRIWSWSIERRNSELAKCQPLCFSCHKEKSILSRIRPLRHGMAGYQRGCRCDECKFAIKLASRQRRSRQKELGLKIT